MELSPNQQEKRKIKVISSLISKEELIRRLKNATKVLNSVDQGDDTSEFNDFASSLVAPFILQHSDKDVKSFAACCLADILRIYAPEPPYDEGDLMNIFCLILDQLKCLRAVESPRYKRSFYVLESLALVKTFNVCIELAAQDVIIDLFKTFFTIVSEKHTARAKTFMVEIMSSLIQEGDSLPQEILDVLLINLIPPYKTRCHESYNLACTLIERCSASLEPYIQLFFNKVMVLGNSVGSVLEDHLYVLLYELFKTNRNVLLAVIPQLEYKLKSNEESERKQAVMLLGQIFIEEEFYHVGSNKPLWYCYLGRFSDVSSDVRLACIKTGKHFLLSKEPSIKEDMSEQLHSRLKDPDEKVRLESVSIICESALEDFGLISEKLFSGVIDRIMDKKWIIRREAVTLIGKVFKMLSSSRKLSKKALDYISLIPSKILHLYRQNNIDDRLLVERVVFGCLIPVSLPREERMRRLFSFYFSLDESALNVFNGIIKQRSRLNKEFVALLEAFKDQNENHDASMIPTLTASLARNIPESHKAQSHITMLLNMCQKNKQLFELFSMCSDVNKECSNIINCISEIIKLVPVKSPAKETLKALLDRVCPMFIDPPSFVYLFKKIKNYMDEYGDEDEEDDELLLIKGKCGLKLVEVLSQVRPSIFHSKVCYEILMDLMKQQDSEIVEKTLRIISNVIGEMEAIDEEFSDLFEPVFQKLLTQGSSKQVKLSLRCLNVIYKDVSLEIEKLFVVLIDKMVINDSYQNLRCTLVAIGELAVLHPVIFEKHHTKIIRDFVVKEVLMIDREVTSSLDESDNEWVEEEDVSGETLLKVTAIKLLTHWLDGLQSQHVERSKPVFKLLVTLLRNDGDLMSEGKISGKNRSRLRLAASLSLLKLVQNVKYVDVITVEQYLQLALTMQDSCYEVREKFTLKLHKALDTLKLSLDYLAFLVLVAVDPVKERQQKVRQMIIKNIQTRREYVKLHSAAATRPYAVLPEYSLPYLVYLLAHHPDFVHTDLNALKEMKDYLWFYLEPILGSKAENFSFVKKLFECIKQARDQQGPHDNVANERIYTVCDIAIGCVMLKNQTFNLKDFPGKVVLPKKLYQFDKNLCNSKTYIPTELFATQKKNQLFELKGMQNTQRKSTKNKGGTQRKRVRLSEQNQYDM